MIELLAYNLKVGACLAVFYLFFKLLLSRETFHRLNRVVVLGAIVASFVLPLCVITLYRELPPTPEVGFEVAYTTQSQPATPWWEWVAGGVFLFGAAGMIASTLWSLGCVVRLIRRGSHQKLDDGVVLVRLDAPVTPFSWGRYIVVSQADLAESGEQILIHERAHLRLGHSWDLLLSDLAGALQWFNPAMWLLLRELRAIHEYEADEAVLDSGADARNYQLLLIKKAAGSRWYSVANSFNHSKLKNRIAMMLREKSSRWAGARLLLVLPLVGLALGAFAQTVYVCPETEPKAPMTVVVMRNDSLKESKLTVVEIGVRTTHVDSTKNFQREEIRVLYASDDAADSSAGKITATPLDGGDTLRTRTIVIRGEQPTAGSQKILYLLDGREISAEEMNRIPPSEIQSMKVSKDASVKVCYPDRDIDGVVEIKTRK